MLDVHDKCGYVDCAQCKYGKQAVTNKIKKSIKDIGFVIAPVMNANPPFAYTVGLTQVKQPELIFIGNFISKTFGNVLGSVCQKVIKDKYKLEEQEILGAVKYNINDEVVEGTVGCMAVRGDYKGDNWQFPITYVKEIYGDNFELKQILIADHNGKLPWHAGFDEQWNMRAQQVILYEPKICGHDGCIKTTHLSKCGNCKTVYYCSKEHQVHNWIIHKKYCIKK